MNTNEYPSFLVSVCMITYNHESYIAEAIEGVVSQQVNFSLELLISDDCSTDQTKAICIAYQQKHPDIIRLIDRDQNLGMNLNFIDTLQRCKGKYIALCEGDDYWIATDKLQKQIDFLEKNQEFNICFHRAKLVYDVNNQKAYPNINSKTPIETTIYDLARENFIHTPSCVFRNQSFEFPSWINTAFPPDWVVHLLNARHGKIYFIKEELCAYRIHAGGVLSTQNNSKYGSVILETFEHLIAFFGDNPVLKQIFTKNYRRQLAHQRGVENIKNENRFIRCYLMVQYSLSYGVLTYLIMGILVLFQAKKTSIWHQRLTDLIISLNRMIARTKQRSKK